MASLSQEFLRKMAKSLEEEETDIYTMHLYAVDGDSMSYFSLEDQEKIKKIFKVLNEDTKHHASILRLILELGKS